VFFFWFAFAFLFTCLLLASGLSGVIFALFFSFRCRYPTFLLPLLLSCLFVARFRLFFSPFFFFEYEGRSPFWRFACFFFSRYNFLQCIRPPLTLIVAFLSGFDFSPDLGEPRSSDLFLRELSRFEADPPCERCND